VFCTDRWQEIKQLQCNGVEHVTCGEKLFLLIISGLQINIYLE
jgi:hypothetical protein